MIFIYLVFQISLVWYSNFHTAVEMCFNKLTDSITALTAPTRTTCLVWVHFAFTHPTIDRTTGITNSFKYRKRLIIKSGLNERRRFAVFERRSYLSMHEDVREEDEPVHGKAARGWDGEWVRFTLSHQASACHLQRILPGVKRCGILVNYEILCIIY